LLQAVQYIADPPQRAEHKGRSITAALQLTSVVLSNSLTHLAAAASSVPDQSHPDQQNPLALLLLAVVVGK
jgi:hypothetical protein